MSRPARLAVLSALLLAAALPGSAATAGDLALPRVGPTNQFTVPGPSDVVFDRDGPFAYVSAVGPPPGVDLYEIDDNGDGHFEGGIDLPSDSEPGAITFGSDGFLYVVDRKKPRVFKICPQCGDVVDILEVPSAGQFPTGMVFGFNNTLITDFGNSQSAGALLVDPQFPMSLNFMQIPLGDTRTPNGIDLLPDPEPALSRLRRSPHFQHVPSKLLVIDANNNDLLQFTDTTMPVDAALPGVPGASGLNPPRDVSVVPVNLTPWVTPTAYRAAAASHATYPVLVPVPGLGNVYWSAGPGGTWRPISSRPIGNPVRAAASCTAIGVTDFGHNRVSFFKLTPSSTSHCDSVGEMAVNGSASNFQVSVAAMTNLKQARIAAALNLSGARAARKVSTTSKALQLSAGTATQVRLKFSRKARSAIAAALRRRHRLFGKLTLRGKSLAGRPAAITRTIRLH